MTFMHRAVESSYEEPAVGLLHMIQLYTQTNAGLFLVGMYQNTSAGTSTAHSLLAVR